MTQHNHWRTVVVIVSMSCLLVLSACGGGNSDTPQEEGRDGGEAESDELTQVTVMLDWVPNTNHTGLYVAQEQGYFAEEGLEVEITTPAETSANQLVGAGNAEFGVSSQEYVIQARAEGIPVVSIAAVLQHNTSGFAAPKEKNITSPQDFVGKTYGGWGSPIENAFLKTVLRMDGVEVDDVEDKVNIVNVGEADFFAATSRDVDFQWIYYGWTGIEAELRDFPIDIIYLNDLDPVLDFYTPTLITNESMIEEKPEIVEKFMRAVSKGYLFAIDEPDAAAEILIEVTPETDPELIRASQQWMSARYRDDAETWGVQDEQRWIDFTDWMVEHELIETAIDPTEAFTNAFLPES